MFTCFSLFGALKKKKDRSTLFFCFSRLFYETFIYHKNITSASFYFFLRVLFFFQFHLFFCAAFLLRPFPVCTQHSGIAVQLLCCAFIAVRGSVSTISMLSSATLSFSFFSTLYVYEKIHSLFIFVSVRILLVLPCFPVFTGRKKTSSPVAVVLQNI